MLRVLTKRTAWTILIGFFIFDSLVSYWAIVYRGAHEANPVIAPIVEAYPLLYFTYIGVVTPIIYLLYKLFTAIAARIFKASSKEILKRCVLTAITIYWALGNSSINLIYILGKRLPAEAWYVTAIAAIIPATTYCLLYLKKREGN